MLDFENWQQVVALYTDYALAVDRNDWPLWTEFFTDDCVYRIQPRENFDGGFPLARAC
jgi:salicylate 5-hydroxylase small subunit